MGVVAIRWGDTMTKPEQNSEVIVVHNSYYAKPGLAEAVYQWRLHASDVRAQFRFPRGRVLRRVKETHQRVPRRNSPNGACHGYVVPGGPASKCQEQLAMYRDSGLAYPILAPQAVGDEALTVVAPRLIRAFAP